MALKLGSLYVGLNANASGLIKGFASAAKAAEKISKDIKRVSSEVAQVSAVMAGLGAAAVRMAASVDGPTKAAMTGLENSTKLLAVQVADMLLPAVREITAAFKSAASIVAGLDPETKKSISNFAVLAVQLAIAAKGLSLVSTMGGSALSALRGIAAVVMGIGVGPLMSIVAAIGLVIGTVVLLHRAWRKNWGGIQEATAEVLTWFKEGFGQFANFMGKVWGFLVDGAADFITGLLNVAAVLEEMTGVKIGPDGVAGLREGFDGLWKDLKSGSFFSEAFKFGKSIGEEVAAGLSEEWAAIKKELGFDELMKGGTPIALGRGMGPPQADAAPSMDTSSLPAMAWFGGMQAAAAEAEGAMTAIAVSFVAGEISANEAAMSAAEQAAAGKRAADAAKTMKQHTDEQAQKVAATFQAVAGSVAGALGEVGGLINTAMSAAASGGPWAALIAVIMEVVEKTASAMEFVGTAMNFVERLATMIEPLVKPIFDVFTDVLGMIVSMIGPLIDAFKPFVDSFVSSIENLMPVFLGIGQVLNALAPIIEMVGGFVDMLTKMAAPIFELIGGALKVVATIILGIVIMFNEIAAALGDTAARAEADRLSAMVDKMWAPGADKLAIAEGKAAGAALRNADAQDAAATAAQRVAQSLTNVPAGYKIANARYQADLGISSGGGYSGGSGSGGVTINGDVNVTTDAESLDALAEDAAAKAAAQERIRERGQRTGNPSRRRGDLD